MKKILVLLIVSLSFGLSITGNVYAEGDAIEVQVTENIPWLECSCDEAGDGDSCPKSIYTCTVEPGFKSIIIIMGKMIKYFTYLATLGGVLFIVFNGIMYSMGGIEQTLKDNAKKRIIQTLIGLLVLFLSGVILSLVAPWVYT